MNDFTALFIIAGLVFIGMAIGGSMLKRLPLSTSLFYLIVGVIIGPIGFDLVHFNLTDNSELVERITEVIVVISLFTAGLKLRVDWRDPIWRVPVILATLSMVVTIALVAALSMGVLGFGLGAAILLGAILAPTDPVLASDVQVEHGEDLDRVRFGLTGEAGLNDGMAFGFVMLGLGLLELHDLGKFGLRWLAIDVLWSVAAGLTIGAILGTSVGYLVLILRRRYRRALGLHEFLTLGLIALSYGLAVAASSYGFLAVFAAGLALGRIERRASYRRIDPKTYRALLLDGGEAPIATHQATASSFLVREILRFNEQIERIGEVAIVVIVGILLSGHGIPIEAAIFVPLLLLVIRPLAVLAGLYTYPMSATQRRLIGWFGIRGIGSLYYLGFAAAHHLDSEMVEEMTGIVLTTIAVSIVVHGVSVTPLMMWYERRRAVEPLGQTTD